MKYIFLSEEFYNTYNHDLYPEIEYKQDRPYILLLLKIDGLTYAIPFRSHIKHNNAFFTDKENYCGVDYTKSIIITDEKYILENYNGKPIRIRPNERKALFGQKYNIIKGLKSYIKEYKRAVKNKVNNKVFVFKISTLQYFHKELGL